MFPKPEHDQVIFDGTTNSPNALIPIIRMLEPIQRRHNLRYPTENSETENANITLNSGDFYQCVQSHQQSKNTRE